MKAQLIEFEKDLSYSAIDLTKRVEMLEKKDQRGDQRKRVKKRFDEQETKKIDEIHKRKLQELESDLKIRAKIEKDEFLKRNKEENCIPKVR